MLTAAIASSDLTSSAQLLAGLEQTGLVSSVVQWTLPMDRIPETMEQVPDVVFLDLAREPEPFFAFANQLRRARPTIKLIACSAAVPPQPSMWLTWRVKSRQHKLRRALPDALDLLVICVEAGLGLDQALMKVSQDMRISHPELSEELQLVNMEMRIGKTRIDALRELARRTGLDDIKALVAMHSAARSAGQVPDQKRIYRAKQQFACCGSLFCACDILQQPARFEAAEICA